jgi:hypothetical protein
LLEKITQETFKRISDGTAISIEKQAFLALDHCLQQRILIHWLSVLKVPFPPSEAFLDEIMRFLIEAKSKSHHIHHAWRIEQNRDWIQIKKNPAESSL